MTLTAFSDRDYQQIRDHGLTNEQVARQLALFEKGAPYVTLVRPCTVGDGIFRFDRRMYDTAISRFEENIRGRRLTKFVPASGAATRMFKSLIRAYADTFKNDPSGANALGESGIKEDPEAAAFMTHIARFAFYPELKRSMAARGENLADAVGRKQYQPILEHLLTETGLNYAALPKGLILFHAYDREARTAFEEHLAESALYAVASDGNTDLHFTVSENYMDRFQRLLEAVRKQYETRFGVRFNVSFSIQRKNTDTLAVDTDNRPFRRSDGTLLLRPGGHGALIGNLNRISGDIIFIKNIDNVAHDHFKPEMTGWKKALAGRLLYLQENIFNFMEKLHETHADPDTAEAAAEFLQQELNCGMPAGFNQLTANKKRKVAADRLNRPIRVCGMVPNAGDPGGGPFWVKDNDGRISLQIVETSQIDPASDQQQAIVNGLTHFNPVDIVCGVKDWKGRPFDLEKFVDPATVFITEKSEGGRDLKALEHPGLWNGAMARWHSVFVEVPAITFNPVKQVTDLLRQAHQPKS